MHRPRCALWVCVGVHVRQSAEPTLSEHGPVPDSSPPACPAIAETYAACVPDAAHTLGGSSEEEPEHPSVLGHLVKQLRPGQNLERVLIPAFFLEPRSLLEKMADTMMHPQLAIA